MKNEKLEKQASSEIAQSREREWRAFSRKRRKYLSDMESFNAGWLAAERDTRERCAQLCDERITYRKARLVSHTAVERISVERLIAEFTELGERIRGKE